MVTLHVCYHNERHVDVSGSVAGVACWIGHSPPSGAPFTARHRESCERVLDFVAKEKDGVGWNKWRETVCVRKCG